MIKQPDMRAAIQEEMRAAFPVAEERVADFYAMQAYHLGWRDVHLQPATLDPGKLLRPQLALLACQAVGGDPAHALPLAAGIQLIHDFSLIHDDIEDQSDTRRGRITVWRQWGLAHGINVGDGMFVVAHLALHRLTRVGVAPVVALEVLHRFDQTILTICEGQFLDLRFEGNLGICEDDYLAMIERKTAALISSSAGLGAMVGQAEPETVAALFDFGRALGLSFQIQDDVLGIWGDPIQTGKPAAADIYRRKVSLPIVHALRSAVDTSALQRVYRQEHVDASDVALVLEVLERAGSRHYAEQRAASFHRDALAALNRVKVGASPEARAALEEIRNLTTMLLGRKS